MDALLSTLADLQQLTDIVLSYNKFYSFPLVLLSLKRLKGLTKSHYSLPELPEEICELCMLEVLDMLFKLSRQYVRVQYDLVAHSRH